MKKIIVLTLIFISTISCKNDVDGNNADNPEPQAEIAFNQKKWQIKNENDYPYRKDMISHLIASDTIKTLNKAGIIDLLGQPDRIDNDHLFYQIDQKRIASWPISTKTLVIKMENDEVVEWVKIHG